MRRFPALSILLISVIVLSAACKKENGSAPPPIVITPPTDFGFKVVGYFPYYRDPATVPDVKFRMTNVVNYAFASVNASGNLLINNAAILSAVIVKSKANNVRVFLSIDGSHTNFKNASATPAGRNNLIREIMNALRSYQLNGVDIDWEFPRTDDGTDISYRDLMKELSDSCHRDAKYYLTAAVTAGKYAGVIRDAIRSEIFEYVDWLNIMAYDDFNTTVPYRQHSDYTLAQTCLNYWVNTRGLPKNKCVIGIPGYGRPSGISQTNNVLTYGAILAQGGSASSDSAMVTSTGHPTPFMIYYNGQPTAKKKAMLAKSMGNGVMFWEKWQDTHDNTSLLKAICDTLGRAY